ncbi:MAG: TetR/AcrR family transcriptional regulator [Hyphomicrobiales bacterium]
MSKRNTREKIVEIADELFYRRGYEHTSFADIAEVVNISRGNFYYHFKTKDDILDAVIKARLAKTQNLLDQWQRDGVQPIYRIRSFIEILITNKTDIMENGCPVGTLCAELAKLDHASLENASELFNLFRDWLRKQFTDLGRADDANGLAMHLLMRSQGVASLANAFHDEDFIRNEVSLMHDWLEKQCASPALASNA